MRRCNCSVSDITNTYLARTISNATLIVVSLYAVARRLDGSAWMPRILLHCEWLALTFLCDGLPRPS